MLRFILADLRRGWPGALAIALIIAFATALGLVVTLQERALRLGSARAANAFDLVVGAPGSETQLVLSSVFLQAAPLPLMPGSVMAGLARDPRVAWVAPVGFGDAYEGMPVVGTSQALIDGLGGLSSGTTFARRGDAVIGASVPLARAATFHPVHAELAAAGEVHQGTTFTVTGRLAPTGTPWDRAILVPIEAVWQTHGFGAEDHHAGEGAGEDHGHHGALDADAPIRPEMLADPDAPGLPAIIVKGRRIADAYNLRQDYRSDHTIAVFPAEVLTWLYGALGDARAVVGAIAIAAQALVAAAILLVAVLHVVQRHAQIGALRAFGASRGVVFLLVWSEVALIAATGIAAGIGLGYATARMIGARMTAASGLRFPIEFAAGDLAFVLGLLAAAGACALIPAAIAYRQSPASALRG
jgi:putative ABC transport system permease protein